MTDENMLARVKRGRFLIDGCWIEARPDQPRFDIITPSTEEIFTSVPCATAEDIDRAVGAARRAFDSGVWPQTTPIERAQVLTGLADGLERHADLLADIWTREVGGLGWHAAGMVTVCVGLVREYARLAADFPFVERRTPTAGGVAGFLLHEAVGVAGLIIPWNAPLLMIATKLAPALAAGCTAVIKTSPEAPLEAVVVGEILQDLGLPPGVVNILMADRVESELLVRDVRVDKISFTGSTVVGRHVASICGERMARATLELGGKSAAVIMDDASPELVAQALVPQFSMLSMQFCSALSRVIVPRHRHDAILDALVSATEQLNVGDPFDAASQMGPMAMRRQLDRLNDFIGSARAEGLEPATGGARPGGLEKGFYVRPAVFGHVPHAARISREEVFGPLLSVIPADDEEHAILLANDTNMGLNNSVFTNDIERAVAVAKRLRSGTVGHNALRSDFGIAFGGYKQSGIGREGGQAGLMHYLESKTMVLDAEPERV